MSTILKFHKWLNEYNDFDNELVTNEDENDNISKEILPEEGTATPEGMNSSLPKRWETINGDVARKFKFKSNNDQMLFLDDIKILFKEYNYFPEILIKDNFITINFGGMEELTTKKTDMADEINLSYDTYNLSIVDMEESPEDEKMLKTYSTFTDKGKK